MSPSRIARYLEPCPGVDSDSDRIRDLSAHLVRDAATHAAAASRLFIFVRDSVRYVPYAPFESIGDYVGGATLDRGYGFCTQKSALLVALARASRIPARFRYADLVNHNMPGRLESVLQSDKMIFHTYAELEIGARWLKATPSFEAPLCQKMGWRLVEFDGACDAVLHPTDLQGRPHIEYVLDRGHDPGIPLEVMLEAWRRGYGEEALARWHAARFDRRMGTQEGPAPVGDFSPKR